MANKEIQLNGSSNNLYPRTGMLYTVFVSDQVDVNANTDASIAIGITIPSGYTAIGIINFNVNNRNFCVAGVRIANSAGTTIAQIRGKNTSESNITTNATVTVLFTPE